MMKRTAELAKSISKLNLSQELSILKLQLIKPTETTDPSQSVYVKFVSNQYLDALKESSIKNNELLKLQVKLARRDPMDCTLLTVPDQSYWSENLGSRFHKQTLLVNVGDEQKVNMNSMRMAMHSAMSFLRGKELYSSVVELPMVGQEPIEEIIRSLSNTCVLSNYVRLDNKYFMDHGESRPKQMKQVSFTYDQVSEPVDHTQLEQYMKFGALVGEGTIQARDWSNEQAMNMNPRVFEGQCRDVCSRNDLALTVLQEPELANQGLDLISAVGQGADCPPRMVVIEYAGDDVHTGNSIGLVGKGVTFDSGGLNLKPTGGIEDMHLDMSGAATVLATIETLAKMDAKVNVVAAIPIAENSIGPKAIKPGSIVQSHSGKFVEICNTDAEGRLILADAMSYIQKNYKVTRMVDVATLTGAICVALGEYTAGVFSNDSHMAHALMTSGESTSERCWQMPIEREHESEITKCDVADLRSMGKSRSGGACTAAAFLKQFVHEGTKWAHLDIAGTGMLSESRGWLCKGGTGFGVNLLTDWILKESETTN